MYLASKMLKIFVFNLVFSTFSIFFKILEYILKAFAMIFMFLGFRLVKCVRNSIVYLNIKRRGYNYFQVVNLIKNDLTPRQFEFFCAELLKYYDYYNIEVTQATNDYGRDIICEHSEFGETYIECKYYKSAHIGREIVQKLSGAMTMHGVKNGVIMTIGELNGNAIESIQMMNKNGQKIKVIDLDCIKNMVKQMDKDDIDSLVYNSFKIA